MAARDGQWLYAAADWAAEISFAKPSAGRYQIVTQPHITPAGNG